MERFFFNLQNRVGLVLDEEGLELSSLEAAREKAIGNIRSLVSEDALRGTIDLTGRIDIICRDEVAEQVDFAEAYEVRLLSTGR